MRFAVFSFLALTMMVMAPMLLASPAVATDRLCDKAVSAAACADHKAYLASGPFYGGRARHVAALHENHRSPVQFRDADRRRR